MSRTVETPGSFWFLGINKNVRVAIFAARTLIAVRKDAKLDLLVHSAMARQPAI
jgi:hypothetical protein